MGRINMRLVDQVMDHIEQNQELWDQSNWAKACFDQDVLDKIGFQAAKAVLAEDPFNPICGTTGCFAGHAVITFGDYKFNTAHLERGHLSGYFSLGEVVHKRTGQSVGIEYAARQELGLYEEEANTLFNGSNGIERLRAMVEFMREHDELPDDWDDTDRDRQRHECDCPHCDATFEDEFD